jgi:hypothetical protein
MQTIVGLRQRFAQLSEPTRQRTIAMSIVVLITAVVLRDMWPQFGTHILQNPDTQFHYWTLWWITTALHTNPMHLFDAPIFYPYSTTLAFSDHMFLLGVLVAPLVWVGVPLAAVLNLLIMASFVLTAWAMWELLRFERVAPWPALLVVIAMTFAPFRMAHIYHLQMLQTMLLPLALWVLQLTLAHPRWFNGYFVGLIGVMLYAVSVSIYHTYMMVCVLGLMGLWWLWQRWRDTRRNVSWDVMRIGFVFVILALAAVVLGWPYRAAQQMTAVSRTTNEMMNWSASLHSFIAVTPDARLWNWVLGDLLNDRAELILGPGLFLAVIGGWGLVRQTVPAQRFWGIVAILGLMLAMGTQWRIVDGGTPVFFPVYAVLAKIVPGFDALRVPARWGWLVTLALAALAGHVMTSQPIFQRRWLMILVSLLVLLELPLPNLTLQPAPTMATAPAVYQWLATQPARRAMLELPMNASGDSAQMGSRQLWQTIHSQRLLTGYSGVIPASIILIARDAQHLPRPDVLARLRAAGLDMIVVHRNEYKPAALIDLETKFAASPDLQKIYGDAESSVYAVVSSQLLRPALTHADTVLVSADQRLPDLVALGMVRSWRDMGVAVTGAPRERFYVALPAIDTLPSHVLIGNDEEPEAYGLTPADMVVTDGQVTLLARPPTLIAFHVLPVATNDITLTVSLQNQLLVNGIAWGTLHDRDITIAVDGAFLQPQTRGKQQWPVGAQIITLRMQPGQSERINVDASSAALVRLRAFAGQVVLPPLQSLPMHIAITATNTTMTVQGVQGSLLLQGIVAATGKAVTIPIETAGDVQLNIAQFAPLADGRYQLLFVSVHRQRVVLANLQVANNQWDVQTIPLPLTLIY